MKLIIEHSKTKREISGNFNICGSAADLRSLAKQILDQVGEEENGNFYYGWVHVVETAPAIANTPPKGWDE